MTAWSFFPAQEGGTSNSLYWLASGLAQVGYEIRVVTTDRYISHESVQFDKWTHLNGFEVIYQTNYQDKTILYDELRKCDVLLNDGVCKLSYFKLVLKAISQGKSVVLSPRGELMSAAIDHKGTFYGFLKRIFFFIIRLLYWDHVVYHATSEDELSSIHKYMGRYCRSILVPNYMILPDVVNNTFVLNRKDYLLYVGRLNAIKNIDELIRSLLLSNVFLKSNLTLKIAGEKDGEYYEYLLNLIKSLSLEGRVEFLGTVTGEQKNILYANAKCLCLMSKSENFGNVVIEALRQGTPVIASTGTPWQILETTGAGFWIEAKPEDIGRCVDAILSLREIDYLNMRQKASSLSNQFNIFLNIHRWVEIIEEFQGTIHK